MISTMIWPVCLVTMSLILRRRAMQDVRYDVEPSVRL
jgi:hypothetical protein